MFLTVDFLSFPGALGVKPLMMPSVIVQDVARRLKMGDNERALYETFKREGIEKPSTSLEMLAVTLAKRLDNVVDERNLPPLSRELRLTLEQIHYQPQPKEDFVDALSKGY
jgi:hypothetical protein